MVIMYLRKSRSDGGTVEEVLSKHYEMLQEMAVQRWGEPIPEEQIYREIASGERISERKVFCRVLELVESDEVEAVMCVDVSRLSRGDLSDCGRVIQTFRYTGTKIYTLRKDYDLSNELDKKFLQMEMLNSSEYLTYVKEILNRGKLFAVKNGVPIASPPYGYKHTKRDKVVTYDVVPDEAAVVRNIYTMYANGESLKQIAKIINDSGIRTHNGCEWTPTQVRRTLTCPTYVGILRYGRKKKITVMEHGELVTNRVITDDYQEYCGNWDAIIEPELYAIAQERIGTNARVRSEYALHNPLAGLVLCPHCKKVMQLTGRGGRKIYLSCTYSKVCRTRSIRIDEMMERVVQSLKDSLANYELVAVDNQPNPSAETKEIIRKRIADMRKRLGIIYDSYESGVYGSDEFIVRKSRAENEIESLEHKLAELESVKVEDVGAKIETLHGVLELLETDGIDVESKNKILKSVIEKIEVITDETIENNSGKERHYDIIVHTLI